MASLRNRPLFHTIVVLVLLFWLVALGASIAVWQSGSADLSAKWGQFGDAFGVVNSLFSGVALIGAIAALALQRSDMEESAQAQRVAAHAQTTQARVAALAAVLESKEFIVTHLRQQLEKGPQAVPIMRGGRKYDLATLADEIARELLQVNELLDSELKQLVPEYHPEKISWRDAGADRAGP